MHGRRSASALIAIFCSAQVLGQVGGLMFAALLPTLMPAWDIDHAEAGWLSGVFFGAYALAVPVLLPLTDRVRPRLIYMAALGATTVSHLLLALLADGFWMAFFCRVLAGVGWAGTYMVGLRALTDELDGATQSRAVSFNAASIGAAGALSFLIGGLVGDAFGWRAAFGVAAIGSVAALVIAWQLFPPGRQPAAGTAPGLMDFGPVLRNRRALGYSVGYCVHTWEMFVVRSWGVAFLTFAVMRETSLPVLLVPTVIAMAMEIVGTTASVAGNEVAQRIGRRRWVLMVMCTGIVCSMLIGWTASLGYVAVALACLVYNAVIYADSAALTAGTVESADPSRKGATLAVHALLGYGGGFVGPLLMGVALEALGGESVANWGIAFSHVGLVLLVGPLALLALARSERR